MFTTCTTSKGATWGPREVLPEPYKTLPKSRPDEWKDILALATLQKYQVSKKTLANSVRYTLLLNLRGHWLARGRSQNAIWLNVYKKARAHEPNKKRNDLMSVQSACFDAFPNEHTMSGRINSRWDNLTQRPSTWDLRLYCFIRLSKRASQFETSLETPTGNCRKSFFNGPGIHMGTGPRKPVWECGQFWALLGNLAWESGVRNQECLEVMGSWGAW